MPGAMVVSLVRGHPLASYFLITFTISWVLASLVVFPSIINGQPVSYFSGVLMFPLMILGPPVTGIVLTRVVDGRSGLRDFTRQLCNWRAGRWYLLIVIPPLCILTILVPLSSLFSPVFTPHVFIFGFGFGVVAGFLEELGWTGYAIRKLKAKYSALTSAVILGLVWGLWHAPVVDFLGAAYPHGQHWVPFFLSFIGMQSAIRVLIVWVYSNTGSIPAAQATHMSSTGSLATLAPLAVSAQQETMWYAIYAVLLWLIVALVALRYGKNLENKKGGPTSCASLRSR